ncbi:TlpA family protein disulfide reductase [Cohnella thailandensis]|uniref:TlpA family protein disulfide reductase n=1 Tax=Cohnella thailandensis TaxID=557557 RepID=A0A841SSC9_9BACL|nr:TlpA disulfide reductase family protein [Cohnella thailandensis]MBB6634844.1 TlpA family protein disulfide reductase [Cohnella thailandensis]MBP1975935.1 thiol-disulfide isomerase/thioredoxin [Cohnella thailandensis]
MNRQWGWVALAAAVALAVVWQFAAERERPAEAKMGEPAPAIRLASPEGREYELRPVDGEAVVLNFWASWCLPCRAEASELNDLAQRHGDRVRVYAINLTDKDRVEDVRGFVREYGLEPPVLLDKSSVAAESYHIASLPTTYVLDEQGLVAWRKLGPVTRSELEEALGLKETSSAGD